ncbi:MAG: ABC transporter permease [Rickettsiales bacterium]|nr:ABC transporter permease [Rickettsiales bacterium]
MTTAHIHHSSLPAMIRSVVSHRSLLLQIVKRDIAERYKGSLLGVLWTFITPILMLLVYGFVFTYVFKARWSHESHAIANSDGAFTVILFSGLMLHGLFVEVITRATTSISNNVNFVKKVVFPLEILVPQLVLSSFFHFMVNLVLLAVAYLFLYQTLQPTLILLPLVIGPLLLLACGIGWFLASLGVYIRDIGHIMGLLSTVLLFISPIFFAIETLPQWGQYLVMLNPLTIIVNAFRDIAIWGVLPDFELLAYYWLVSILIVISGFFWFQKTRKGFADVL